MNCKKFFFIPAMAVFAVILFLNSQILNAQNKSYAAGANNSKVFKDQKMIDYAKMVLAKPDTEKPYHRNEKEYAQRILFTQDWPDEINIVLQVFRIGDLGIAAIPFETFAEIGLAIKEKSPFKPTFTIELANGYYGYLPTPEQHKLGGYETWLNTNKVEIEASNKIIAKLMQLFSRLK